MPIDTEKAHAKLLDRLLSQMEEVFVTALEHPKTIDMDRNVAAEALLWIRDGRFLCQQIQAIPGSYNPAPDDPLVNGLLTLDAQITDMNRELRKMHLHTVGAPDRLRALLDGQPAQ